MSTSSSGAARISLIRWGSIQARSLLTKTHPGADTTSFTAPSRSCAEKTMNGTSGATARTRAWTWATSSVGSR